MSGSVFHGRRAARAAAGLMAGLTAGAALANPAYSPAGVSQCLTFANNAEQPQPFTNAPMLGFAINGGPKHTVTMDTGSVGIAIGAQNIPDFAKLKAGPEAKPGTQFLSSSKILWTGTWVPVTVTLYDGETPVATSSVPVLGVEQAVICRDYQGGPTCPSPSGTADASKVVYMGVGFGREADSQPQGTPDKNALLNITHIAGKPIDPATYTRGYVIGKTGITVGLTPGNTQGFRFVKLTPNAAAPTDWTPAPMCVQVNDSPCMAGTVLVDTGIPQSYLTVPTATAFQTVKAPDASMKSVMIDVLANGTKVAVQIPDATAPAGGESFVVGGGSPVEPLQVIPWRSDTRPVFINTGRHFLRQTQFLYDAKNGYIGLKPQTEGCGG
ncbi:MAG TPA: hypothetical protein VEH84_13000 [Alphaproteobacteria bacterium]|nr:hypothetical protein [Alphaproteobacteria bacterium]